MPFGLLVLQTSTKQNLSAKQGMPQKTVIPKRLKVYKILLEEVHECIEISSFGVLQILWESFSLIV